MITQETLRLDLFITLPRECRETAHEKRRERRDAEDAETTAQWLVLPIRRVLRFVNPA